MEINKLIIAESFRDQVLKTAHEMVEQNQTEALLYGGEENEHLKVVLGGEHPEALTVLEPPDDLKNRIAGRIYIVPAE